MRGEWSRTWGKKEGRSKVVVLVGAKVTEVNFAPDSAMWAEEGPKVESQLRTKVG